MVDNQAHVAEGKIEEAK